MAAAMFFPHIQNKITFVEVCRTTKLCSLYKPYVFFSMMFIVLKVLFGSGQTGGCIVSFKRSCLYLSLLFKAWDSIIYTKNCLLAAIYIYKYLSAIFLSNFTAQVLNKLAPSFARLICLEIGIIFFPPHSKYW